MSNEKKVMLTRWNAQQQKWAIIDNADDLASAASVFLPQAPSVSESINLLREKIIANKT